MKVHVDRDLCEANGLCMDACSEVFEVTEEDELRVHENKITPLLRAALEEAARVCPRGALFLEG
jgi:ferredoxin